MFKVGLIKFADTPSCIEVIISYHVENYEVIIDSTIWNVYDDVIPDEVINNHGTQPDHLCPHVCMGGEKLCPYICSHKKFESAKDACKYFNSINKRKVLVQNVEAEAHSIMHSICREQAKLKWEDDVKAFRDEFKELTKKIWFRYGGCIRGLWG